MPVHEVEKELDTTERLNSNNDTVAKYTSIKTDVYK